MSNQASKDRQAALHFRKEPPRDKLVERNARFAALNRYVSERQGWLTSIPGDADVVLETLPDSTLPDEVAIASASS
jgi:hypothetical protein